MKYKLIKEENQYTLLIFNNNGRLFQRYDKFTACPVYAEYFLEKYKKQIGQCKILFS